MWGRMGQSEGVLTSSGDCARASSVCRDPGMLWFNLKATERDRPLLQQGSRNLQSEPDGENYHRFKTMHDFFFLHRKLNLFTLQGLGASSASGSPACSCLPSAAAINNGDTNTIHSVTIVYPVL